MARIVHHKKFQILFFIKHQTRFCSNQFYISTKPANLFQKNSSPPPTFSCSIDMTYLQQAIVIILLSLIPHSIHAIRLLSRLSDNNRLPEYNKVSQYLNREECSKAHNSLSVCDPSLVHIAMTLDFKYLRGSIAAIHSVLKHASCPENVYFHFIASGSSSSELGNIVESTFPRLGFKVYPFDENAVKDLISSSIRQALEEPLNYARIYLGEIIQPCVDRVIYLDSDTILIDDIEKLWGIDLSGGRVIGAPEYCHVKFSTYFSDRFWSDSVLSRVFNGKKPCYFNTGVMVMNLGRWRGGEYTNKIEKWMRIQKETRIYELGSLPPFLLLFGGEIEALDHRWNQHGLGGDNMVNSCRSLHPGPVSILHWSGKEKPWVRLDLGRPCPVDHLWAPYDLYRTRGFPRQYHKG